MVLIGSHYAMRIVVFTYIISSNNIIESCVFVYCIEESASYLRGGLSVSDCFAQRK